MNARTLQRVDRWLGVPLCAGLTVLRRARDIFGRRETLPVRRMVIVKLAEQGATVIAYPALRAAVDRLGRGNVWFVTFDINRDIVDVLDLIPAENVLVVSVRGVAVFLRSAAAVIGQLRAADIDCAVDLDFFSRGSAALTFLAGTGRRIGFHAFAGAGPYRGNLFTHRLIYNPHLHTAESFLALVEAAGEAEPTDPCVRRVVRVENDEVPLIVPTDAELAAVRHRVGGDRPGVRLILLNANTSDLIPLRRWPPARYVELAQRLLDRFPAARVVFTGSTAEAPAIAQLVAAVGSDRCVSAAGQTTLRELLALYTLAEVLVTNDSGPAHFATLTPIRVVTLFGPETPRLFGARTTRNRVLWAGLACSPCVTAFNNRVSPCRDNRCMQAISVEQVFAAVTEALAARASAAGALERGPEGSAAQNDAGV